MPDAVLVIDMLRGFMERDYPLYCGDLARKIIPNVQSLLDSELQRGSRAFFICDAHDPDDPEFALFPKHSVAGTREAEIIPELRHYPMEVVPKKRLAHFFHGDLEEQIRSIGAKRIVVCGVCTNICILHCVYDACRDYAVEVPTDCVASFNMVGHRYALEHMEKVLGARLTIAVPIPPPVYRKFPVSPQVLLGDTADIYFLRTVEILRHEQINPTATMEVFPSRPGVLCGMDQVLTLLDNILPCANREVWSLSEGDAFDAKEVVLRITAPYQSYGAYETAYLGILAQCSGWATAARECVQAAQGKPVISFGVRHVHPDMASMLDYAATVGGCSGCSSVAGAELAGISPSGTIPHALVIVMKDTLRATLAFDRHMPPEVPRIALVDTFKDEAQESVDVARGMDGRLMGVRLDTPHERGGVTPDLVRETRARLDLAGYSDVKIYASGGFTAAKIGDFAAAGVPVDAYGVGSYISGARPIDFTADLHALEGEPIAKRGRIPGITPNIRLKRVL